MIDIIIPAYNAHKTIKRTLYSIMYQKNVNDLNVYIINDNSDIDYQEEVNYFKQFINIKELKLDKSMGPGLTRQYGLDHSSSKYIIFIDSDDVFYSPLSITELYKTIEQGYDLVITDYLSQKKDRSFDVYSDTLLGLHGKIYRRLFIKKNNICFFDLKGEEDTAFNNLFSLYNPKIYNYEITTYMYLYNKESITNKKRYKLNNTCYFIESINRIIDKTTHDNINKSKLKELCFKSLVISYLEQVKINKDLKKIYKTYLNIKNEIDEKDIYTQIYNRYLEEDYERIIELDSYSKYIERIMGDKYD